MSTHSHEIVTFNGEFIAETDPVTDAIPAHNDTTGKQGGTTNEYYHLTATQLSALHAAITVSDTSTIDFTLTGQALTADVKPAGISHTAIADIGTNTHSQIDTFIGTTVPATYLKLDTSNDPLTDALHFTSDTEYIDQETW